MVRPTREIKEQAVVDLGSRARASTDMALKVLTGIASSPKAPHAARVSAAAIILDRGWGKAPQQLVGEDGGDIRVTIRQIIETVTVSAIDDDEKLIDHDDPATS
jgi:hypothetical protein